MDWFRMLQHACSILAFVCLLLIYIKMARESKRKTNTKKAADK
ncbi:hypothetical protein [Alkalicoccobacillus porphyridii]|nr:hypothetical protein [Alkalicoccobacillus porphyridii]